MVLAEGRLRIEQELDDVVAPDHRGDDAQCHEHAGQDNQPVSDAVTAFGHARSVSATTSQAKASTYSTLRIIRHV